MHDDKKMCHDRFDSTRHDPAVELLFAQPETLAISSAGSILLVIVKTFFASAPAGTNAAD